MSRFRSIAAYPQQYKWLVEQAATTGKEYALSFENALLATKFRGHFYAFIGALKRAAAAGREAKVRSHADQEAIDLEPLAAQVMVQVRPLPGGRAECVFTNREHSWQAKAFGNLQEREIGAGAGTGAGVPEAIPAQGIGPSKELLQAIGMLPPEEEK